MVVAIDPPTLCYSGQAPIAQACTGSRVGCISRTRHACHYSLCGENEPAFLIGGPRPPLQLPALYLDSLCAPCPLRL